MQLAISLSAHIFLKIQSYPQWMRLLRCLETLKIWHTHLWPFSKSKFNLKSDRVNLVALASPIECQLHLPTVRAIQYKLGQEKLTRIGNSNVLRLPVNQLVKLSLRSGSDKVKEWRTKSFYKKRHNFPVAGNHDYKETDSIHFFSRLWSLILCG